jgi:hypothetical protein
MLLLAVAAAYTAAELLLLCFAVVLNALLPLPLPLLHGSWLHMLLLQEARRGGRLSDESDRCVKPRCSMAAASCAELSDTAELLLLLCWLGVCTLLPAEWLIGSMFSGQELGYRNTFCCKTSMIRTPSVTPRSRALQFDASALATVDLFTTEYFQVKFPYHKLAILILQYDQDAGQADVLPHSEAFQQCKGCTMHGKAFCQVQCCV